MTYHAMVALMLADLDNDALLDALDEERKKFTQADDVRMHAMVNELIRRGVYPNETVEGNPNSVWTMVEGYGARWHVWREPLACQHCGADLRDHRTGPPFKREVGLYDDKLDCTTGFYCPDCKVNLSAGSTAWKRVLDGKTPAS